MSPHSRRTGASPGRPWRVTVEERVVATRRKTTRRKTTGRAAPSGPVRPGPGERLWALQVPFEARQAATYLGARWDGVRRCHVYVGTELPDTLTGWLPTPFSWPAWQASEESGQWPDMPGDGSFTLRPHQVEAAAQMVAAHQLGRPQWVLADDLGLGKTLSAIAGVQSLPPSMRTVLVIAPLSVIPAWRDTLTRFGTGGRRWCVVSTDSLKQLLTVPPAAHAAKTTKTRNKRIVDQGRPTVSWDVVIVDESHRLKTPTAQRTRAARTLSKGAFVVAMSATLGSNPLELSYLSPTLAHVTGARASDLAEFEAWAQSQGFAVERGEFGKWTWDEQPADLDRLRGLLFDPPPDGTRVPVGLRRRPTELAGWPEQDRVLRPVELDGDQRRLYDEAWTAFRRELRLARQGGDPAGGFAATLRFRQKASLLKAGAAVQTIVDLVEDGFQPVVSVAFLETLDDLVDQLSGRGVTVVSIDGSMPPADREHERVAFQTGQAQVIVHTLTEGVNLHASERGANGVPRVTVVADPRPSVLQARQLEGRAQRDGQRAPALYLYADDTVEATVMRRLVERLIAMATLHGDDDDLDALLADLAA